MARTKDIAPIVEKGRRRRKREAVDGIDAAPRTIVSSRAAMWIGKSIDYLGWPRRRLHSPRAERMKVKPPRPPSAQSVQTKKKPPVDLAISP